MDLYDNSTGSLAEKLIMEALPHNISEIWEPLAPGQHTIIGVYLLIVGVTGLLDNTAIIATLYRYRRVLTSPHYLPIVHLCISDLGICTLSGFPFSGVSSLSGRWLYGDSGCQFYAFCGFFFGLANVCFLTLIAVIRYLSLNPETKLRVTKAAVYRGTILVWFSSLAWSVAPLLGWASYDYEPSVTTCTINWRNNNPSYKSYMICLTLLVFVLPVITIIYCYYQSLNQLKIVKSEGDHRRYAVERSSIVLGIILTVAYVCLWSLYALVCLWTVFYTVESVPMILTVIPPLFAKITPVLNPLLILYFDLRLRSATWSTVMCKASPSDLQISPETEPMTQRP